MPSPEYMTTRPEDTEALRTLDRSGATAREFIEYQDGLSGRIVDAGGSTNEGNLLRAFWPQLQSPVDGYTGSTPDDVFGSIKLARHLQHKEHYVVARTNTKEQPYLPRVQIDQFGILLETGNPESVVVSYTIEECEDASPEDEEAAVDAPYFLGRISVATLWTPNTASARRTEDILSQYITQEHTILEVERTIGESTVDVITQNSSLREMELLVGGKDIVEAIKNHALASERILDQSRRALHSAVFSRANKRQ